MTHKVLWNVVLVVPAMLSAALVATLPAAAQSLSGTEVQSATTVASEPLSAAQAPLATSSVDSLTQIVQYSSEGDRQAQVNSISQLSDVQPTDWAYTALQRLVEEYDCIEGYPDSTFKGSRALTRYEFAAGLNACLDRVSELIAKSTADLATKEDLATLQRLQEEFQAELATLRGRVDGLEVRTAELEANQFSTTTKLRGETIFAVSDIFGDGVNDTNETVFQNRVRLNFDTSFTGKDRLRARLQSGNFTRFNTTDSTGTSVLGNEGRLGFDTDTSNAVVLDQLVYRFPVGDRITTQVWANGGGLDDFVNTITPFDSSGRGAVSRFGQRNPIYRAPSVSAGAGATFTLNDAIDLSFGYLAGENSSPNSGAGLFNGNYGLIGQLTFTPGDRFALGLTYVNSYTQGLDSSGSAIGNSTGTGSSLARVRSGRPTAVNAYGVEANYKIGTGFQIGGWAGYSNVRAIGLGDADVWNYAVTLAFPDLGGEGNLGGIVVGIQPQLTGSDELLGAKLGRRSDPDTGLHLEGFYRYQLNDNISITPGVIWLTAPNHNENNDDVFIGTIRTTFTF